MLPAPTDLRSSPWEALQRLAEARGHLFQLWAVAQGIPDARYGLTAILDTEGASMPPGIDRTVAGPDRAELLAAGQYMAQALSEVSAQLAADGRFTMPVELARFVTADLAAMASPEAD